MNDVPQSSHLIVSIPSDGAGLVIGKAGGTFKQIENDSKAKPFLQCDGDLINLKESKEKLFILAGSESAIIAAMKMAIGILIDRKTNTVRSDGTPKPNNPDYIDWLIPEQMCGILIGKGGQSIKDINSKSGANVAIHPEDKTKTPQPMERYFFLTFTIVCSIFNVCRLVEITGTPEQCRDALALVTAVATGRPASRSFIVPFGSLRNLLLMLSGSE